MMIQSKQPASPTQWSLKDGSQGTMDLKVPLFPNIIDISPKYGLRTLSTWAPALVNTDSPRIVLLKD